MFCDDNDDYYPRRDKGNLISGRFPNRVRVWNYGIVKNTLYTHLGTYLAGGATDPVLTCPLYKGTGYSTSFWPPDGGPKINCSAGGLRGCLLHGAIHTRDGSSAYSSTLNFYGGLEKYKPSSSAEDYFPLKNREKLGDPYVIKIGNYIHELNILWADVLGTVGRPTGGTPAPSHFYQMYHEPPPGSSYGFPSNGSEEDGKLYVYSIGAGGMGINYSYDDGSAKSIQLPAIPIWGAHWSWRADYYSDWYIYSSSDHQLYSKE